MINLLIDSSLNHNNPYCGISSDTEQFIFHLKKNKTISLTEFALSSKPLPEKILTVKNVSFLTNKIFGLFGKKLGIDTSGFNIFLCQNINNYNISKNTKKIIRVHDLIPLEHPKKVHLTSYLLFKHNINYNFSEKNNFYVCNSENTKKRFLRLFPQLLERTFVIPCSSTYMNKNISLTKPEIIPNKNFLLSVSSLEPKKNVIRLLKAYEKYICSTNNSMPLILVGSYGWKNKQDVEYLSYLKKKYTSKIIHLQKISQNELAWLYKNCFSFIMPSLIEGFGIPILDALAFAKPVLCSNIAVFHEIAGDAAIYFNPLSVEDIYNSLTKIHSDKDLAKDKSDKSLARSKKFAPDILQESWKKLVEEIYAK